MPIESARSGGRACIIHWCREPSFWMCQRATAASQMEPGTMMKLGWFSDNTMEQFVMSRHQHKPATSTAACDLQCSLRYIC